MKRFYYLYLLFYCISNVLIGQDGLGSIIDQGKDLVYQGYYDSAVVTLQRAKTIIDGPEKAEKLVELYYLLGDAFLNNGGCDSARFYIQLGLSKSQEESQEAEGYYVLAKALGGCLNENSEAKKVLRKSIALKRKLYGEESQEVLVSYNLMGYLFDFTVELDSAFYFLAKSLEIDSNNSDIDSVELSVTYFYLGKVHQQKNDLKKALDYYYKALKIREGKLRPDHPSISNCLNDLGSTYQQMGNFDLALKYSLQGLEIRKKSLGSEHVNVGASYYAIGNLYGGMFDYRRAIHFIEQGNLIIEKRFGEKLPVLHVYYAYLGRLYHKAGDDKKARRFFKKAERLAELYVPEDHLYRASIYNIIGQYYIDLDSIDKQKEYHQKALKILESKQQQEVMKADILLKLGEASSKQSDLAKANTYYLEALEVYQKKLGKKNPKVATIHQYYGDLKKQQNDMSGALDEYWKSLESLSYDEIDRETGIDLNLLTHKQMALNSIHRIANTNSANQFTPTEQLENSLKFYLKAIDLIDLIASEYKQEDSRSQLAKDTRRVFNDAIRRAYDLYQIKKDPALIELIFKIIEKSKSPILLARIQENNARQFSGIPDSLFSKERNLRVELSYFKEQLRNALASGDKEKIKFFKNEVFNTRNDYHALKESFKNEFPNYYSYRYANQIIELGELQKRLNNGVSLIEYYESDNAIYVMSISKENVSLDSFTVSDTLYRSMKNYHRSLTDNTFIVNEPEKADSTYVYSASYLFNQLIRPLNITDKTSLIIIPDGRLSKLNFGTFLTENPTTGKVRYDQLKYLISDQSISYAHSATLNFRPNHTFAGRSFAGFAPSYETTTYTDIDSSQHPMTYELVRNGRLALPGAINEVQEISNFMDGRVWVNEKASESNFKQNAKSYSIIHLAMHSLLNNNEPEFSELLFNQQEDTLNDGYLTIDEIYNLDLRAAMVVLSACSSGEGRLQTGEGPISFTRAFSYAGCPSVIMSMWKLPDASTKKIMVDFYRNIKAGDSKDVALKKAQLGYLKKTDDPLYQHPFFWGSFVALGSVDPVVDDGPSGRYILYLVMVILLAIFLLRNRLFGIVEKAD